MSDLTKRLRDLDDRIKAHFERGPCASIGPGTCGEAADRIEQLEAALRELVRLKAIKDRIDAHLADESERIDYAVNKPHAWHNARALIGEA